MQTTDNLLTRAVEQVVPKDLAEKKLASGKPIRIYWGIDPTGSKLHLGHSVPLRKFKAFQDAGHEVIFLIGSFTAMIGDPSGQDKMRKPLTREQVEDNFQTYKKQASKILDFSKTKIVYNHEWLESLKLQEIVELASIFTVQQMIARDMFQTRLEPKIAMKCKNCNTHQYVILKNLPKLKKQPENQNDIPDFLKSGQCTSCNKNSEFEYVGYLEGSPIGLHEFLYPLMVGYDSVVLDVDCEMGGSDQLFNMLCGRTLQTALGKRDKFVLTTRLLEGTDGRKMSKTYGNCIYLNDEPNDMFGKVMSIKDDLTETYFECCTDVPMEEVKAVLAGNPRDAKARLGREIVALYHGAEAAEAAETAFNKVFKEKELPEDMPEVKVKKGSALIDVIVENKLAPSKSEARRLIEQGGVKLNNKVVQSVEASAEEGILKVGKRKFLRITL